MQKLLLFLLMTTGLSAWPFSYLLAQTALEPCGVDFLEQSLSQSDPAHERRSADLDRLFKQEILAQRARAPRSQDTIRYTLPVVFHILHQGSFANIPDARVYTEMAHLNAAFRNLGLYDPSIGVDVYIEFCLAQVAPDGTASSGITRHDTPFTEIESGDDFDMKSLFNWDPTRYLNIYVVAGINFNGQAIAGYAYYPTSAGQFWDGVVVRQSVVGLSEAESGTTVHEIGHYLGLPHPFNGGCANDDCLLQGDRVCDTPPDNSSVVFEGCGSPNNNCTTDADDPSPQNPFTTDVPDDNTLFMDYNIGNCRLAFSDGQSERMRTALRILRPGLLESAVCSIPKTYDAGITGILNPITTECDPIFSPQVVLHNFGLVPVNNVDIYYQVDEGPIYIANWNGFLLYTESTLITLPPPGFVTPGLRRLRVYTVNPNGIADLFAANDTASVLFNYQPAPSLPLAVDFEAGIPGNWSIDNPSGTGWQWGDYGCDPGSAVNHCLYFDNSFFYAGGLEPEGFVSPLIDLRNVTAANLRFDLAYGFAPGIGANEDLQVEISTDCGQSFLPETLFRQSGNALSTQTIALTDPGIWIPQSCDDWRTETLSLQAFLGQQVVIRFRLEKYDNGFPLFLDNIRIDGAFSTGLGASLPAAVRLFPNPVQDLLQVEIKLAQPQRLQLQLLDIRGKATGIGATLDPAQTASENLSLAGLAGGVYLLEIRGGDFVRTEKVFVQ